MATLNRLIIYCSQHAWLFLLSMLITFGCLYAVFLPLGKAFAELTDGQQMFDFQNALTTAQVAEQLPIYSDAAKQIYYAFSFTDFFFPFFASLFLVAIAAFSLRHLAPWAYASVTDRKLWPVLMLGAAFDWLENIFALIVVSAAPESTPTAATLLVLAKRAKLAAVMVAQAVSWGLLLLATGKWLAVRVGILKPESEA